MNNKHTTRDLVLAVIAGEIDHVREMHAAGVSVTEPDQYGWLPICSTLCWLFGLHGRLEDIMVFDGERGSFSKT